jgi:hypothetical protein
VLGTGLEACQYWCHTLGEIAQCLPSAKPIVYNTTGKRQIAVRQNVCRALFIGRMTNVDFAVRFLDDARQTKTHGIYILCCAFLWGRTAITNLCRAFSYGRTAIIAH